MLGAVFLEFHPTVFKCKQHADFVKATMGDRLMECDLFSKRFESEKKPLSKYYTKHNRFAIYRSLIAIDVCQVSSSTAGRSFEFFG